MLEPKVKAAELRALYDSNPAIDKAHMLILGEKGAGKTSLIKTCPKPIHIFSFDPGGTVVLKDEIANGSIIADIRYEAETMQAPFAANLFQKEFEELENSGYLSNLGTLVIDGITGLSNAIKWRILKNESRTTPSLTVPSGTKGMQKSDWGVMRDILNMIAMQVAHAPCHTITLGHIGKYQDEVTGGTIKSLLVQGGAKDTVPAIIPELLVIRNHSDGPRGIVRQLQTYAADGFLCSARMGGGKFDKFESADIQALLKKAGMAWEDKEPL